MDGTFTTMTGICTSGIWLTRSFLSASSPMHMSTMTIATVVTGLLMLKFESNMAYLFDFSVVASAAVPASSTICPFASDEEG